LMSNGASFFHLFCLGYPMIFIEMWHTHYSLKYLHDWILVV
jgi:hypothetical protein